MLSSDERAELQRHSADVEKWTAGRNAVLAQFGDRHRRLQDLASQPLIPGAKSGPVCGLNPQQGRELEQLYGEIAATEYDYNSTHPKPDPIETPATILKFINDRTAVNHLLQLNGQSIDQDKTHSVARAMLMTLGAICPSILGDFALSDPNPNVGLAMISAWCKNAMSSSTPDSAGTKDELVIRTEVAHLMKIDPSAVTKFVRDRLNLRENDTRGSKIYFERFRSAWEKEHSAAQRDEEIRQRTEKRVNQDARRAEKELADD